MEIIHELVKGQVALETTPGSPISSSNPLAVRENSFNSAENSSTTILTANDTFEGQWVDVQQFSVIIVSVKSDVASATDGLMVEWSSDGSTKRGEDVFTIPANTDKTFSFQPVRRYVRVKYTNSASNQSLFDLETQLKADYVKPSSHRIADPIISDDDAELVKAVITGLRDDGSFDNASLTNKGQFKVSIEEYGDTPSVDAFARLRISENFTIFDSKQLHDKQPLFWDEKLGGSATSTHDSTNAAVEMTVTASASDYVIRQTKQRFNYQPGKSQLVLMTLYSPQVEGITSRIGIFDDDGSGNNLTPNNGIFFECNNALSWNVAKNGSITETITQTNWNVDKLDGTGVSDITLDMSDVQILIIDYEWLGVGRIRVGFVIDGLIYYCHYFNHANNGFSSVYMSTPNLPLRYSIESDGTNGSQLDHICSTVISEGGIEQTGILRSIDTGTTHVDADTANTTYATVGLRLKDTYKDVTVLPEFFSMINEQSQDFRWSLCLNPTIAGTFTYADVTNSAIQKATGATANTVSNEGTVLDSGYIRATNQGGGSTGRKFVTSLRVGSQIDGTKDELVLCVTPLAANADISSSLTFRELL
jgi:hypothetical protein